MSEDAPERRRGLPALLPQLFTTANLAAGFYSIVSASAGDLDRAAFAIFVAIACDVLDGRVARMAGVTSRFGFEYDSIADTVSFGVAPAILAFHTGALQELGWTGLVLAFVFTACAALRLARFNVKPARWPGRFEGLPSPAAAGMLAATTWQALLVREAGGEIGVPALVSGLGVAFLGLLMVSPIPYRSFKEVRLPRGGTVLVVAFFAVLFAKPSVTFPLFGLAYVLSGPVEWLWRWQRGRGLAETPEDEASSGSGPGATPLHPGRAHSQRPR